MVLEHEPGVGHPHRRLGSLSRIQSDRLLQHEAKLKPMRGQRFGAGGHVDGLLGPFENKIKPRSHTVGDRRLRWVYLPLDLQISQGLGVDCRKINLQGSHVPDKYTGVDVLEGGAGKRFLLAPLVQRGEIDTLEILGGEELDPVQNLVVGRRVTDKLRVELALAGVHLAALLEEPAGAHPGAYRLHPGGVDHEVAEGLRQNDIGATLWNILKRDLVGHLTHHRHHLGQVRVGFNNGTNGLGQV
mmetsp:Transcript_11945/g.25776  ORF Transcript_11945/g.25776 Transcript_11945/m.25776 type:complete len:243 (-) Transcript_11945:105-833(-)